MIRKTLLVLFAVVSLAACSALPAGHAGRPSVEEAAEQLRQLMVDPDKAKLEGLAADDLSYGHSAGKVDTKTSFIADLMSGASDFVTIKISDQSVKRTGDLAVVRHLLTATTNDGGKPGNVAIKVLQVWTLTDGRWQLIARQAVRPPQ